MLVYLPVRLGGHYFGHSMGKGRAGIHMEDREGILAINQTACRQNHRDETSTGVVQEWERRRSG